MDKEFFKNNIKDLTIEELTTIKNWLLERPNYVNQKESLEVIDELLKERK
mgnify:CR=1 FL=1